MKRSKITFSVLFILFSVICSSQVGIGTATPAATLDINAANLTGTTVDGLLIPRVSRLRAQTMAGTPVSTVLYVNDVSNGSATGTTINVTSVGFYFFNGTVWERLASGAANSWSVTGNSGLFGTTNFLGTTDNVDLAFRRFNTAAGKIGATSTSFGLNALTAGAATNNAAFGTNALAASTGANNVAIGNGTLSSNTTGVQNTGIGNASLAVNTGSASTAVGFQALNANTNGNNGTAVGFQALFRNTTASNNTGIGFQALTNNTTGSGNTALGFQSANNNSTGNQNTAIGYQAAFGSTSGNNTAMGYQALFFNSSGGNNTAIGRHAMHNNTNSSNNTAIGQQALLSNTTATGNTAVGSDALRISTGANNTAVGKSAGDEHGGGANNTYIGFEAGRYNTGAANNNAFLGYQAGLYSTGSFNTAIGSNTLKANFATSNNVAVGYNALTATTTSNNTAIGFGALATNTTGSANVALGYNAGTLETGSNKLYIENSNANANGALIYGEFDTNIVRVNGTLQISNPATANGYAFPNVRGTNGQLLQTDGVGGTSWVANTAATLSMVRVNLAASQNLSNTGWQKIFFNNEVFDTANEFNSATSRFTATKPGFYRINASFHTNIQANTNLYSIGIILNGTDYYQMTSSDHHGIGSVERSVTCLIQLALNDEIEIFAENFVNGVTLDNFSGKTVLEIQQVR
ncbi:MAG: hypothetical protein ITG00_10890 [Flavobacterium sp.]|nr:hypothetical protein [Flavobacterium sp.]